MTIKYNPNDWMAYYYKAVLFSYDDHVKMLENAHKAASLHRGSFLPLILSQICQGYRNTGFPEKARYYAEEILKLNGDSAEYFDNLASDEQLLGNNAEELRLEKKAFAMDSTSRLYAIGEAYMFNGQYKESLKYFKKLIEITKPTGYLLLWNMHRIGYVYWQNGYRKEADYYFDKQIEYDNNENKLGRFRSEELFTYYDLAGVYAFRGEKEKAYENLRIFNQKKIIHAWVLWFIKNDPLFNSIRNEPEFQQIISDMETKYQAEHERVGKWLEEQGTGS